MEPVVKKKGEDIDRLIRRFKKYSKDLHIEMKGKRYYKKPSEIKNIANEAKKHIRKKEKKAVLALKLKTNARKRRGFDVGKKRKPREDRRYRK